MSIEQLLFIALFVAIAIFNLLRQARSRRRAPDGTDGAPPAEPEPARPPPRVVIARPVPPPVPTRRPAAEAPRPAVAPPVGRPRARRRLRTRRDARRGIVLITVLGSCRGLEPLAPEGPAAIAPR